jgi:hypothetical protein
LYRRADDENVVSRELLPYTKAIIQQQLLYQVAFTASRTRENTQTEWF